MPAPDPKGTDGKPDDTPKQQFRAMIFEVAEILTDVAGFIDLLLDELEAGRLDVGQAERESTIKTAREFAEALRDGDSMRSASILQRVGLTDEALRDFGGVN